MFAHPRHRRLSRPRLAIVALMAVGALGALPGAAAAAPKTAFVTDEGSSMTDQYIIGADGTLSFNASVPAGSEPWMQAVTPNGKYLYVANYSGGGINQYSISSAGTLTALSPAVVATGDNPYGIAVSPDGQNVYVANSESASLGVYDIGSGGALTLAATVTTGLAFPTGVAISPDGTSVYVGDSGKIDEFNRASDGTLTPKAVPSVTSDFADYGMVVISPDGTSVYTSSTVNNLVDEYTVGSGGELTPKATPSATAGSGIDDFYAMTISPNGKNVYVPDYSDGDGGGVYQFSVGTDGELAPMSPFEVPAGSGSIFIWPNASGTQAYVTNYGGDSISQYNVSSSGALSPMSTPTVSAGSELLSIMIPPDQSPVAKFTEKVAKAGKATKFNGSQSYAPDGTVTSYHWSFGDGHSLTTTKAAVSHTYKKAGKHKVTLTVTDDSGCSTALVFTGQNAYCSGSRAATVHHTVKVASATKPLKISVTPSSAKAAQLTCYAFTVTSKSKHVGGASVKLAGRTARTSDGKATLCLTLKKGTYAARASRSGYATAAARIRVSAASPVFTG